MKKLFCLLLTLLLLALTASAEPAALGIDTPAEAIRPGKAFVLNFTVPAQGSCDLVLRDVAGNFVMDVLSGVSVNAGANQLWWNGTSFGVSPAEGAYQLALVMDGQEAACTVVIGDHAPYLTSIVPTKHAENRTMTVDFYASVEGLLTLGLWNGNVWSLLENRQIGAGMNQVTWDASGITQDTTALTLTLTDGTGFSSNEEHISVSPSDFGLTFETATPAPTEVVLTPMPAPTAEPADDWDVIIDIDHDEAEALETEVTPVPVATAAPTLTPAPVEEIVYTPSYCSAYPLTEKDAGTYWGTPMDITDTEAIWQMLSAPITVIDADYKGQKKVYAAPDENSRTVAVVTGSSQGVRVIETREDGWSLIELYSSTFHDNSIQAWNMLVQGYVKTSMLETKEVNKKYHMIVDKLTQRLYLFGEGKHLATLLVSTGVSNAEQPYNETRSGEFLYISPTGGFRSDNMFCPMGMKFNDGDLLHEVPYIQRYEGGSKIYSATEPFLGSRASHGCIRVQRRENADGYNMKWIWDHKKDVGRIVVWEDWQGRQIPYPADDTILYYNPNGGSYYHAAEKCESAKASITFDPFTYAELDTGSFAKLDFCPYCAPALRMEEIDKINEAHAVGGDHDPILTAARQKYLDKVVKNHGVEALTEGEKRYYQQSGN